ncbi:MAG: CDP-diacylglycerol--glycerol-3-phosphate 3-phosphatidyltransferase [Candidatus Altiarchaeales archaeon WOR_SM1_79]|nr:MAG: CDP-diacylglycerol--glycerol-3-phosphate 3-phosphatidyltransferase [Candidatus Altiarchaeales archaeon WOR_SM1_79]
MWNLPNALTILRILAIPLIVLLLFYPGKIASFVASIIFLFAAITDGLDGYIARRQNIVTTLGKFLDPMADKLLVITSLIMLIHLGRVPAWIVAIIAGREIAVTGLRAIAINEGIVISASQLGKYKTLLQVIATTTLICHYPYYSIDLHNVGMIFLWAALVLTVWSGLDYFRGFFRQWGEIPAMVDKK